MADKNHPIDKDPGIYEGLSFAEYLLIDAINHSTLKDFSSDTPFHYKYRQDNELIEEKDAFSEGRIIHTAILEPKLFEETYMHTPKNWRDYEDKLPKDQIKRLEKDPSWFFDKRGKAYKIANKIFEAEYEAARKKNPKLRKVDYLLYWKSQEMRKMVLQNKIAKKMLEKSETELTLVWIDPGTGLKCKCRIDIANKEDHYFGDLKTTKNAHPYGFAKDTRNYNYYSQVAFYWDGCVETGLLNPRYFMFLSVENFEPFFVQPFLIRENSTWLEAGREWYRSQIEKLNYCKETGDWHGYYDELNDSYDLYELPELMDKRY